MAPIHHIVEGKGSPPIVLVHGLCCGHTDWRHQVGQFAGGHMTVAVDLPGHGATPPGPDAATIEQCGTEVEALLGALRKKSLDKLKDAIREKTRRNRGDSLERIIDGSVRRKQRMKRSHIGQGLGLSRLWPNACFAEHGLFALHAAWAAARQSR